MADYPDIYADNVTVSVSPFGVTLTFVRSDPALEPGPQPVIRTETVGRIRLSPALASTLAEVITKTMAQASASAQAAVQASTIKH
jgi:hypothetical protein